MSIYDFTVKNYLHEDVTLSQYRGKVLLIVNTATHCGLTPQYEQLEALYRKYSSRGFELLDFPCNQFKEQAPGTDEEINQFCQLNYDTTFPRFARVDVNGDQAAPLFVFLKNQVDETDDADAPAFRERVKALTPFGGPKDIKWNFSKFLVNREGQVVSWFAPTYKPEDLAAAVEKSL
jgi:glutathione peroxidase